MRVQLPRIVYALSNQNLKIRARKGAFRDTVADAWLGASLWRKFGAAVCDAREASPSRLTALAHTYEGFGGSLEMWHQADFPDDPYLGLGQDVYQIGPKLVDGVAGLLAKALGHTE